jgi:hypothetical protein
MTFTEPVRVHLVDSRRPANALIDEMLWAQRCGFVGFEIGDRAVHFAPYAPTRVNADADRTPRFTAFFDVHLQDMVVRCHQVGTRADGTECHAACGELLHRRTDSIGEVLADMEARVAEYLRT